MGKVLKTFTNGFPGAVSRAVDEVVLSLRNGSGGNIAFGQPVFLKTDGSNSVTVFDSGMSDATRFVGFAVRPGDKTPDEYGSSTAAWKSNEPVDILVRGSVIVQIETAATPGQQVYIRVSDGKLTTSAGSSGSTIALPHVNARTARDSAGRCEITVKERNLL